MAFKCCGALASGARISSSAARTPLAMSRPPQTMIRAPGDKVADRISVVAQAVLHIAAADHAGERGLEAGETAIDRALRDVDCVKEIGGGSRPPQYR